MLFNVIMFFCQIKNDHEIRSKVTRSPKKYSYPYARWDSSWQITSGAWIKAMGLSGKENFKHINGLVS
jgi:hypothetical protein